MNKMTPEEFKNKLISIQNQYGDDPEALHSAADNILCECLSSLGYGEGIDIFNNMEKWYS